MQFFRVQHTNHLKKEGVSIILMIKSESGHAFMNYDIKSFIEVQSIHNLIERAEEKFAILTIISP